MRKTGRGETIVRARFHSIGPRSRKNQPAWHVYVNGELNPDITVQYDQTYKMMIAVSGDIERASALENLSQAAAVAAWKVVQNIY